MQYNTHTRTQPFYSSMDFVRDNPGEPVPEETFTHSHLSWSSIVSYLLHPSTTIHGILPMQSTCLTIFFHNLSLQAFFGLQYNGYLIYTRYKQNCPLADYTVQHRQSWHATQHKAGRHFEDILPSQPISLLLLKTDWIQHRTNQWLQTHTHTQPFYCSAEICPGLPGWAGTRKVKPGRVKPIWIYWSKR